MKKSIRWKWPAFAALVSLAIWMSPVEALQNTSTNSSFQQDQMISDHVEDEMQSDQAVSAHNIDIETSEGIVRLSGNVDNLLAKRRSTKIAQAVKGVRAVVNNIAVKPGSKHTDKQIQKNIESALLLDPATESYEITPTVQKGFVTLDGSVQSWQEKQLAEKVAAGVTGVLGITNSIDVDFESQRPDSELVREVRETLKWDVYVPNHALIDVEATDGEVKLSGTVGSASEKSRAYSQAWITGVKSVDFTDLEVKSWHADSQLRNDPYIEATDAEIQEAVSDAMLYDPYVNSFNVSVDVDHRSVTLRGTVDNLTAKHAAAKNARNTAGVLNVYNRVKVRLGDSILSDESIEKNVEAALLRNPYVERFEISTIVNNGEVNLYGTVDTYFEKSQAEEAASSVLGAVVVDNNIVVTKTNDPFLYDPFIDDTLDYDYQWELDSTPSAGDSEIAENVESEIFWSPFVDSDQVTVSVDNGVATLTGTVDSWTERDSAQENAYEGGAIFVDNDLIVK